MYILTKITSISYLVILTALKTKYVNNSIMVKWSIHLHPNLVCSYVRAVVISHV